HPGNHPVGSTLPTTLAIAEKDGLPGWRLIEAFVAGVEIHARVFIARGTSTKLPGHGGPLHSPPVASMQSPAPAAGKLLGLDVQRTRMAMRIAAARTGRIDSAGAMCSPAGSGNAAFCGVQAAVIAQHGFIGRDSPIEQPFGYG